eukprot:GHVN01095181.1.p1 GENE.GHVN01095181.1~~GHVN01095181.1.p1  ORF type:complete len:1015 (+),score=229.09 GHVN01095181.1:515-3559(+)
MVTPQRGKPSQWNQSTPTIPFPPSDEEYPRLLATSPRNSSTPLPLHPPNDITPSCHRSASSTHRKPHINNNRATGQTSTIRQSPHRTNLTPPCNDTSAGIDPSPVCTGIEQNCAALVDAHRDSFGDSVNGGMLMSSNGGSSDTVVTDGAEGMEPHRDSVTETACVGVYATRTFLEYQKRPSLICRSCSMPEADGTEERLSRAFEKLMFPRDGSGDSVDGNEPLRWIKEAPPLGTQINEAVASLRPTGRQQSEPFHRSSSQLQTAVEASWQLGASTNGIVPLPHDELLLPIEKREEQASRTPTGSTPLTPSFHLSPSAHTPPIRVTSPRPGQFALEYTFVEPFHLGRSALKGIQKKTSNLPEADDAVGDLELGEDEGNDEDEIGDTSHRVEAPMTKQVYDLIPLHEGKKTSYGSIAHASNKCKPCVFYNNPQKQCANSVYCRFCHFTHQPKKRLRLSKKRREDVKRYTAFLSQRPSNSLSESVFINFINSKRDDLPVNEMVLQHAGTAAKLSSEQMEWLKKQALQKGCPTPSVNQNTIHDSFKTNTMDINIPTSSADQAPYPPNKIPVSPASQIQPQALLSLPSTGSLHQMLQLQFHSPSSHHSPPTNSPRSRDSPHDESTILSNKPSQDNHQSLTQQSRQSTHSTPQPQFPQYLTHSPLAQPSYPVTPTSHYSQYCPTGGFTPPTTYYPIHSLTHHPHHLFTPQRDTPPQTTPHLQPRTPPLAPFSMVTTESSLRHSADPYTLSSLRHSADPYTLSSQTHLNHFGLKLQQKGHGPVPDSPPVTPPLTHYTSPPHLNELLMREAALIQQLSQTNQLFSPSAPTSTSMQYLSPIGAYSGNTSTMTPIANATNPLFGTTGMVGHDPVLLSPSLCCLPLTSPINQPFALPPDAAAYHSPCPSAQQGDVHFNLPSPQHKLPPHQQMQNAMMGQQSLTHQMLSPHQWQFNPHSSHLNPNSSHLNPNSSHLNHHSSHLNHHSSLAQQSVNGDHNKQPTSPHSNLSFFQAQVVKGNPNIFGG